METATHVLRLMCAGVFDRFPRAKVIIGHMGELIPFHLKRINLGLTKGAQLLAGQAAAEGAAPRRGMQKTILDYMRDKEKLAHGNAERLLKLT